VPESCANSRFCRRQVGREARDLSFSYWQQGHRSCSEAGLCSAPRPPRRPRGKRFIRGQPASAHRCPAPPTDLTSPVMQRPWCVGRRCVSAYGLAILEPRCWIGLACQRLAKLDSPRRWRMRHSCRRERPDVVLAGNRLPRRAGHGSWWPPTGLPTDRSKFTLGAECLSSRYLQRLKPRYRRFCLQLCSAVVVEITARWRAPLRGPGERAGHATPRLLISPIGRRSPIPLSSGADPAASAPLFLAAGLEDASLARERCR